MALSAEERSLLQETHDGVIGLSSRFDGLEKQVEINRKVLFGNSRWGLKANVRLLMWVVGLVAAGVIAAIATVLRMGITNN